MIYQPSDDTFLLGEQVKIYSKNKSVIDIGTGSGYLAKIALKCKAKKVTAIDINKEAIKILKEDKNIKSIHSDLFKKIKEEDKFDLIIFNPPYLPLDKKEPKDSRLATTGGKKGDEVILKFLKQAKKHMKKDSVILLLLSSLTPMDRIKRTISNLKMKYEKISQKEVFFESLFVLKIQKH